MTPNDIDVLMHCYVTSEPHPRIHAPAVRESLARFVKDGLVQAVSENGGFETTSRGNAHVKQICKLPLPRAAWVNSDGEIIL